MQIFKRSVAALKRVAASVCVNPAAKARQLLLHLGRARRLQSRRKGNRHGIWNEEEADEAPETPET